MKVTVTWHRGALQDLAAIYLKKTGESRRQLRDAVREIDELLKVDPSRKGRGLFAGQLTNEMLEILLARVGYYPELVRKVSCGPVEVIYTPHEEDGQAKIWVLQERTPRS